VRWGWIDGVRTVPFVQHLPGRLSVAEEQRRLAESRSNRVTRRRLRAAAAAAQCATDGSTFTAADVQNELAHAGHPRAEVTVAERLQAEAAREDSFLLRTRPGAYLVAGTPQADGAAGARPRVADHLLVAFRRLLEAGEDAVTVSELREQLAALGLRYSQRAVYHGLAELRDAVIPAVVRAHGSRYRLTPEGVG
jgi:hypothetical protein